MNELMKIRERKKYLERKKGKEIEMNAEGLENFWFFIQGHCNVKQKEFWSVEIIYHLTF